MTTKTTKPRQTKDTKAKQPSASEPKRASATKGKAKASTNNGALKKGGVAPEQPVQAIETSPATEPTTQAAIDAPVLASTEPVTKPTRSKPTKTKPVPASSEEPAAPAKASKPSKKPTPASMPKAPALDAAKPWLAKVNRATLADAAKGFLEELEADGASESTVSGYRRELKIAMDHFGEARLLALIAPHEVAAFNQCPAVMVARDGAPKAEPSFQRTRRVLRLALCWAVEQGLLETAPLPAKAPRKSKESAATAS